MSTERCPKCLGSFCQCEDFPKLKQGEKCPKCGATLSMSSSTGVRLWECQSYLSDNKLLQTENCRIVELEAEVKRLTKNVGDVYQLLEESREIRRELGTAIERLKGTIADYLPEADQDTSRKVFVQLFKRMQKERLI